MLVFQLAETKSFTSFKEKFGLSFETHKIVSGISCWDGLVKFFNGYGYQDLNAKEPHKYCLDGLDSYSLYI